VKKAIRDHLRDFIAILALLGAAGVVTVYVLANMDVRFPLVQSAPMQIEAHMSTAQAVTPGQGQTVRVSGIRVGDIVGVELKDGKGVIRMNILDEYRGLVRKDASGFLRPRTGLKDMFFDMNPGSTDEPAAEEGDVIPVQNTLPDVNPDEIWSALDADTRDYLKLFLHGGARGLKDRSDDLDEVLQLFEPTHRDLARFNGEVVKRRQELRRLISSLRILNQELADKDDDLAELVDTSATTFRAFASERDNVAGTVRELPSSLQQATSTLRRVEDMARVLGPTVERLRPAVRQLDRTNRALTPFQRETTPIIRDQIRPFVREARPVIRDLRPPVRDLNDALPPLTRSFRGLNHIFNTLAFNKDGREPPEKRDRDEGFLFYWAWVSHQSNNIFSMQDAHGPFRPLTVGGTCGTLRAMAQQNQAAEFLFGLTAPLTDPTLCEGKGAEGLLPFLEDDIPSPGLPNDGLVSSSSKNGERKDEDGSAGKDGKGASAGDGESDGAVSGSAKAGAKAAPDAPAQKDEQAAAGEGGEGTP
jgi:phospholipid/cholesterol/gamma-HCH transport system substrate-binding protein